MKKCYTRLFIIALMFVNCENSPTNTTDTNSDNIKGIWAVVKKVESDVEYDAGFVINNYESTKYVKDTLLDIYLFGDGQCTIYSFIESYSDTGTGKYNVNMCYRRYVYGLQVSQTMLTGDDEIWNGKSPYYSVHWGTSVSDSCSHIRKTLYEFENDTLVISFVEEMTCTDNRSSTTIWKNYLVRYSGTIPPSNWPSLCN